jgi:hypothetical protein
MKVIDIINKSKSTVFSFELLPPLKGNDTRKMYQTIESLVDFDPKYINITTHRDEIEFKEMPDGTIVKRTVRKRPGNGCHCCRYSAQIRNSGCATHSLRGFYKKRNRTCFN